jgi:NAD(P)-dependent dehydrogenase (short-subunit alcohol dehydrogenase family)
MTPIRTPFGSDSTAAEVAAGVELPGRRAIVTGAASGIGIETARALAGTGAEVTLAVRNLQAGERTAAEITAATGNPAVRVAYLELGDRESIAAFVAGWDGPLHLLVNNAGVMAIPQLELTPEGIETQFAVNHLGHFALALGLRDAMASDGAARIVSVSSSAHLRSPVIFDDLNFAFMPYDPWAAYGQAKTANVLFAVEATRRWAGDGITVNALMPGAIATNLQRHSGGMKTAADLQKTPQQGAATSVLLAVSPLLDGIGGRYFNDCNEAEVLTHRPEVALTGVAPYALDPGNAERLWETSLALLGRDSSDRR